MLSGFPADNAFDIPTDLDDFTNSEFETAISLLLLSAKRSLGAKTTSALSVVNGVIAPTAAVHSIISETVSTPDSVTRISTAGVADGHILFLYKNSTSGDITLVKNGAGGSGSIYPADQANVLLTNNTDGILLQLRSGAWRELTPRSSYAVSQRRFITRITSSGNFTVPDGISRVWASLIAPGGGGAGGGGEQLGSYLGGGGGTNGGNGGDVSFGSYVSATGGVGGQAGSCLLGGDSGGSMGDNGRDAWLTHFASNSYRQGRGGRNMCPRYETYGKGGNGGNGGWTSSVANVFAGGGGGAGNSGELVMRFPVDVIAGQVIAVTIGAVGSAGTGGSGSGGGASGSNGSAGSPGLVIVEG